MCVPRPGRCSLVAGLALGLSLPGLLAAANYTFPPSSPWTYSYGVKPDADFDGAWPADGNALQTLWNTYKTNYLTTSGAGSGERIICSAQQSGDTVSEGIGYGMILAVYFNDQTTFNDLYTYEQSHLDSLGLMNWDISSSGSVIGSNSASDGDEDIAYALWLAHYQWGDGTTDYTSEATTQTNLVEENDLDGDLRVKPGDSYDSCQYPSYFMPSEYVVFGNLAGDSGTWSTVSSNCYQTISDACNATSGLIADQTADTGVGGGCTDASSTEYQYNSCRVPFYMALDYVYYGNSGAQTELGLLAKFFSAIAPGAVDDCYTVNQGGTSSSCSSNIDHDSFVGPAGCSLMLSSTYSTELQSYYDALMAQGTTSYFDDSWQLLSLLLMQGDMPNIADPAAIYTPTATPTETPYAGTPTPTATETPGASGLVFEDFEYGQLSDGYTYASTSSTSSQTVDTAAAESGTYGDAITWDVVSGGTAGQYGGAGFNSNYANDEGVIDASGTTQVQIFFKNATGAASFSFYLEFKEGGTTTTAVAGGHGFQWDSPAITVPESTAWNVTDVALSSFTLDKYATGNVTSTSAPGTSMALASMMTCQIQTDAVWSGTLDVDNIVFLPPTAFTPTPTPTPLVNPYTEIWDDFESPLSLSVTSTTDIGCCNAYCSVTYDASAGASASWALTMTAGDYVEGTHGGALTYNTGSDANGGWGADGTDVSPYGNAQLYSNETGAAYLAFYIKAPAGFRYQAEFQEAGTTGTAVDGADGAAWLSAMQTAVSPTAWQYVELPIAQFTEDPYDTLCNPAGILPSPCLSEGDTQQLQAIEGVSFKLAAGQGSGVIYFDNIAFITTWKTPTPSLTPSAGPSFTRSPSPTDSPTPTRTASPTATSTDSPSDTPTDSPTATSTDTPTDSPTATPTDTQTATPTASPTASPTATPTASPTISPTFTSVPVGSSPTDTPTISPTFSISPSQTDTPTATPSASPTASPTLTASPTSTVSPTPSVTLTLTVTPTLTLSASPVVSPSDTPQGTLTDTPTATPSLTSSGTPTASDSPTATPTSTPSGTPTATPSWTATSPDTATATPTFTLTPSFSDTPTQSPTATPSFTLTPTPAASAPTLQSMTPSAGTVVSAAGGFTIAITATGVQPGAAIVYGGQVLATTTSTAGTGGAVILTATAPAEPAGATQVTVTVDNPAPGQSSVSASQLGEASAGDTLKLGTPSPTPGTANATTLILSSMPAPNPNPQAVMVDLSMGVDSVQLRVYSAAFHLVGVYTSGSLPAGWQSVSLPPALANASNGVYYYLVKATRNGGTLGAPKVGKLFIMR